MDGLARRFFMIVLVLALGACSLRGAMNAMTSEEDRALAQAMVESLRTNNRPWLQQHFSPELWAESAKTLDQAPQAVSLTACPLTRSSRGG